MLWFFLFIAWVWLLIVMFGDIFRSDVSGWKKAFWTIFVIILPYLGVLVYLIVHGGKMHERSAKQAMEMEQAQQDYIRSVAGTQSTANQLAKLAELRDQGGLTDAEFEAQKATLLR
jgi:ABC-type multidrug transport system fused ATPase/permease subunit